MSRRRYRSIIASYPIPKKRTANFSKRAASERHSFRVYQPRSRHGHRQQSAANDLFAANLDEQHPDDWWHALCQAVPACLAQAGASAEQVAALAIDATSCTVLAVDAYGVPLRPALMWMDKYL